MAKTAGDTVCVYTYFSTLQMSSTYFNRGPDMVLIQETSEEKRGSLMEGK